MYAVKFCTSINGQKWLYIYSSKQESGDYPIKCHISGLIIILIRHDFRSFFLTPWWKLKHEKGQDQTTLILWHMDKKILNLKI